MLIIVLKFFLKKNEKVTTRSPMIQNQRDPTAKQLRQSHRRLVSWHVATSENRRRLFCVCSRSTLEFPRRDSIFHIDILLFGGGTKDSICRWRDSLPNYYASAKLVSNRWIRFKVKSTDWKVRPKNCTSV